MTRVVETALGKLQGEALDGIEVYRGIPYAMPPVGDLRFRSPQRSDPWTGILDAAAFGAAGTEGARFFAGSDPAATTLGEQVMDSWVAFARDGNPNHSGIVDWPTYLPTDLSTLMLGASCELVRAPLEAERRLWDDLI